MSAIRRRSTVHDLASLRLHPDGSRVQNLSVVSADVENYTEGGVSNQRQTASVNLGSRVATTTVRDLQGNWIARDAGGRATMMQKRSVFRKKDKDGEASNTDEEHFDLVREPQGGSAALETETDGEEGDESVKDPRAQKRMKFLHDFSFLGANSPPNGGSDSPNCDHDMVDKIILPVPSSDLLKCIHHFASEYYAATGLLYDAGREFRRESKIRKMQKLRHLTIKGTRRRDFGCDNDGQNDTEEDQGNNSEENDSDDQDLQWDTKKFRARNSTKDKARRDMYRAFDGSALMAIGMLVQEHVLQMMSNSPPEGWEEQMREHKASVNHPRKGGQRRHRAKGHAKDEKTVQEGPVEGDTESIKAEKGRDDSPASASSDSS